MKLRHGSTFALLLVCALFLLTPSTVMAQTTELTHRGKLIEGGTPATGTYDMQFKIFDSAILGTQVGPTNTKPSVEVTDGAFTVLLNFGPGVFTGPARFLEVGSRPAGSPDEYTIASPREKITSSPYAMRSLSAASADNATQLGGVPSSTYVQESDTRLSDARPPTAGSNDYIQNSAVQQSGANFNISGNGTVGGVLFAGAISGATVDATNQYNITGTRVLSIEGTSNLFAGVGAGQFNTTGSNNAFFGRDAGKATTTGYSNAFFGSHAGAANTSACCNSFFGSGAGKANTTGINNSFFGIIAGRDNTTGDANSFFGADAGLSNITGSSNSFFGAFSGEYNTAGVNNAYFGAMAGRFNTTGNGNSFFGAYSGVVNTGGSNSFFGNGSGAVNTTGGGNSFFGTSVGVSNTTGSSNSFFGFVAGFSNTTGNYNSVYGSHAGESNTTGNDNSFFGINAGWANTTANGNSFFGTSAGFANTTGTSNAFFGAYAGLANTTANNNSLFGSSAGRNSTSGAGNSFFGSSSGYANTTGSNNAFFGTNAGNTNTVGVNNTVIGSNADVGSTNLVFATAIGAGAVVNTSNSIQLGRTVDFVRVPGWLVVANLASGGSTALCRNASNQVSFCSSSLRYKTDVTPFAGGLSLVHQLRPITFKWKTDGTLDVGFGAEDVARIAPLFVSRNAEGEVEGVKYDRISVALVNAIKEQQSQIEQQQKQLNSLTRIVCLDHPGADICR